jgi:FkbM family methyltransferase
MFARRVAELLFRNVWYKRRLPKSFGSRPIYVSPDAALRWLARSSYAFEKALLDLADTVQPGEVVWDIGASVGGFAIPAATRASFTLAVEADPFLASLLSRTVRQNPDLDVHVLCAAVSDRFGRDRFAISGRGRNASGLTAGRLSTMHGRSRQTISVPTTTLDALLSSLPAPDLLKIDIEGAELLALQGATHILNVIRPRLYIEARPPIRVEVEAFLARAGYDCAPRGDHDLLALPRMTALAA